MHHDLSAPAQVMWHGDEERPPEEWSGAIRFATLREALDAIFTGAPQTGHPWVLCDGHIIAPRESEAMWLESTAR